MKLTKPQAAGLDLLRRAADGASTDGAVPQGWSLHRKTAESLQKLGLCEVVIGHTGGYVRRGRWLKPALFWSARITDEGRRAYEKNKED